MDSKRSASLRGICASPHSSDDCPSEISAEFLEPAWLPRFNDLLNTLQEAHKKKQAPPPIQVTLPPPRGVFPRVQHPISPSSESKTSYYNSHIAADNTPRPMEVAFRDENGRVTPSPALHPRCRRRRGSRVAATLIPSRRRDESLLAQPPPSPWRSRASVCSTEALKMEPYHEFAGHIASQPALGDSVYFLEEPKITQEETQHFEDSRVHQRSTSSPQDTTRLEQLPKARVKERRPSNSHKKVCSWLSGMPPNQSLITCQSSSSKPVSRCPVCGSCTNGRGRPRMNQAPCFHCNIGGTWMTPSLRQIP
ncbi:hypothetical protein QBC47DRAFT_132841 [Echria macrotheca]|uniref:Uncharacterized protein n=1 Tax=Echria macrotheca TaxID=438768 RepID=A0AAJ0FDX0_9PEZI|nr:hypothetical protein QBC47DRAFT_132841 [Echria macrotheca]